jgi:Tfp pilus assembly protein PilX
MMKKSLIIKIQRQTGVVLVISLILLLALTLIGVTGSNVTGLEEKMAGNNKDVNLAFQAAESALRFAEANLSAARPTATTTPTRTSVIANQGAFAGSVGYYTLLQDNAIISNGIQTKNPDPILATALPCVGGESASYCISGFFSSPSYSTTTNCANCVNWAGTNPKNYIEYTNSSFSSLARPPEYIIEELLNIGGSGSSTAAGGGLGGGSDTPIASVTSGNTITYRITARGWGINANSVATVQSIVKVTY